jgi:hypothetical protein
MSSQASKLFLSSTKLHYSTQYAFLADLRSNRGIPKIQVLKTFLFVFIGNQINIK